MYNVTKHWSWLMAEVKEEKQQQQIRWSLPVGFPFLAFDADSLRAAQKWKSGLFALLR